jgi:hypothetical protein
VVVSTPAAAAAVIIFMYEYKTGDTCIFETGLLKDKGVTP